MPKELLQCSVITPEAQVFDGRVEFVVLPAHDGEIGVLPNRAPLLCRLGAGEMRVRGEGLHECWFVDAGFAQVLNNRVVVLTQKALRPDQIDPAQAEAQLAAARQMPVPDELTARRKDRAQAGARALLRMAGR